MSSDNSFFKNDKKKTHTFSEFGSSPSKFLSILFIYLLILFSLFIIFSHFLYHLT